jgi:threonine aldolase
MPRLSATRHAVTICHGGEVIVEASAHIYNSEGGGLSVLAGAVPRPVRGDYGVLDPDDVKAAIVARGQSALAPTKLICLENTHNASGGTVLPLQTMAAIHSVAKQAGLALHVDGARLFNAATYLGVPVIEVCKQTDSVWFALCKGLGAPVGAILAGDKAFMTRARQAAKMLGGAMRQAGVIAAPAIVALKDPYSVHRRDHELAQRLARGLAAVDPSLVQVERVHTNIVNCFVDRFADDAAVVNRALKQRGVLANHKRAKIRFVTHYHIDEAAVDAAIDRFAEVIEPLRKAA